MTTDTDTAQGRVMEIASRIETEHASLIDFIRESKEHNPIFDSALNNYNSSNLAIFSRGFRFQATHSLPMTSFNGKAPLCSEGEETLTAYILRNKTKRVSYDQLEAVYAELADRAKKIRQRIQQAFHVKDEAYSNIRDLYREFVLPTLNHLPVFET